MIWSRLGGEGTCGGQCQTDVPDPKLHNGPNDGLKRPANRLVQASLQLISFTCVTFKQRSCVALPGRMTLKRDSGEHP